MKLFICLILFAGILMVIQGIHTDQMKMIKERVKVEYRFVPRSYYDEMLFDKQFASLTDDLNNTDDQWYTRNI